VRLEDWFPPLDERLLTDPLHYGRDASLSDATSRFCNLAPLHGLRLIGPFTEFAIQEIQIELLVRLNLCDGALVDTGAAVIPLDLLPSQRQVRATLHLVNPGLDLLLLPWFVLRCWGVVSFHSLLPAGVGSFTSGTVQRSGTSSLLLDTPPRSVAYGAFPLCPAFWATQRRCTPQRSGAFCADGVPEYCTPLRLLAAPRLELRFRLSPPLPPGGSRALFVFSVARPFVCGYHSLSPLPALRTLPGLPGSRVSLPHRVARPPRGTLGRNQSAFASIVPARPFPSLGRPVPLGDSSLRVRPGGAPQALQTPPRGGRPALRKMARGGCRSVLAVSSFRLRARVDFSIPSSSFGQCGITPTFGYRPVAAGRAGLQPA
jgi:hypothetical protein